MYTKYYIGGGVLVAAIAVTLFFWPWNKLKDTIALPYISHQQPVLDPHLPAPDPLSDKLDEAVYDGLFNISANPSGVIYEDGLGELVGVTTDNQVIIRLKPAKKWHQSFTPALDDEEVTVTEGSPVLVTDKDLRFTLRRILALGSLSPDYILVSQALETFDFVGPDANNEVRFQLKATRIWTENDVKEVFSFKILPATSELNQAAYPFGTGPYLVVKPTGIPDLYIRNPAGEATITNLILKPFIDNSTYQTEFSNGEFNFLPGTPFGAVSPILNDPEEFFAKANISTTLFGVLFNTTRLSLEQRKALKTLLNKQEILSRFFKIGTPQQRNILDYTGKENNFNDFLNYSVFPSSSYYVDEEIITIDKSTPVADLSVLPDSIRIKVNLNYGNREELAELIQILNDPAVSNGKIRASTATEEEIAAGNYDALLMGFNGYRSNFLFDLYDIFLREPDLKTYRINLVTNGMGGTVNAKSFKQERNFFRLDSETTENAEEVKLLLNYVYGFMSSHNIGDKQEYARRIDELEKQLALGSWLFSLPSLNYFSTQYDPASIYLYGVSSQLSTVEKWKEKKED
ncbi:MAG: hypothetical protein LCH54_08660 [Bacteroidetes bacterium]|nr:hypothetical protein [Bacteroidota bacterium]MCA0446288.1 hypothetical protein [Bacteroidota bacterium]